ncbi:MAG: glycoside hydrolase family 113, partial [Promethearchaeota archaeon]
MKINKENLFFNLILLIIILSLYFSTALLSIDYFRSTVYQPDPSYSSIPFQYGMGFVKWGSSKFNTTDIKNDILEMKSLGIDWVCVHSWWYQDNISSTIINDAEDPNVSGLYDLFDFIHAQGMKVFYKPMLGSKDGIWRSFIIVTPEWIQEYNRIMLKAAEIAKNGGVELFSIGCEMGSWQIHTEDVIDLIHQIRAIYPGLLTYSANHDSFWQVEFWDYLDIIGIDIYYPFTVTYNPTYQEMLDVWNGAYDKFNRFQRKYNKPIIFTEMGRQKVDGSNIGHFFFESDEQDILECQLFFETFFHSKLWTAPWFKGVYWWIWDTKNQDPQEDKSMDMDHPVMKFTIEKYYKKERNIIIPSYNLEQVFIGIIFLG